MLEEVSFFLPGESDLEALKSLDPDEDWRELQIGERAWVLQTWLRLASAGHPVRLCGEPPSGGIVVFHAKHEGVLRRYGRRLGEAVLLGIRADNREPLIADFETVQNGRYADGRRSFFLPFWPQPGLLPRDPARGTAIRRVAFKGFEQNLHPDFRTPDWRDFLTGKEIEWEVDAVPFAGAATDRFGTDWPDFRAVDLILAVRPGDRHLWTSKPATKLFNAWQAGVPVLLGPEHAYRELRRSELDYLEVGSLEEAKAAVTRLLESPDLYRAMVENGRVRGEEFTVEATLARWVDLLGVKIPALIPSCCNRRIPLPLRAAGRWLRRTAALRPPR